MWKERENKMHKKKNQNKILAVTTNKNTKRGRKNRKGCLKFKENFH